MIVNRSVEWWENQTLHQQSTITDLTIEDLTLFTFVYALLLGAAAYVWMMIHRFRLAWLERQDERFGLDDAIARRRAEAADMAAVAAAVDASADGEHDEGASR